MENIPPIYETIRIPCEELPENNPNPLNLSISQLIKNLPKNQHIFGDQTFLMIDRLIGVLDESLDNFVIVENGSGWIIMLFSEFDNPEFSLLDYLNLRKHDIFCYKVAGVETVVKPFIYQN